MTTNEDLDRLRLAAEDAAGGPPSVEQVDALVELVDALEAELAARQPSGDDREALIDVVKRNRSVVKRMSDGYPSVAFVTDETIADAILAAGFSRAAVPDAATEAKQPEGWSTEDRQEAKREAERRWSRPAMRYAEQRYQAGNINGFILGAEWQKARETFISYKVIADEARAERDAALAAIGRIRQAVSGHPECDRYEEGDVISCGWKSAYASVVAALDGAPEPEVKP